MTIIHRLAIFFSGSVLCAVAHGQNICWVDEVRTSGVGVRVALKPDYQHALAAITRAGVGKLEPVTNPGASFTLAEGDVAHLLGLHSGCEITAAREAGRLGVRLEASSSHPWFGTSTANAFVPAEQ